MKSIFLFFSILSSSAWALVDMRTANYSATWTDMEVAGTGFDLKVVRTYNSRSLFNGMFGFGWCSDFETSLEIMPEGSIKTRECGSGQTNFYSPKEIGKREVDSTIEQIIAKMRAEKKTSLSEDYISNLKKDLFDNNSKRSQLAQKYGIQFKIKEGTKFYANGKEVDFIVLNKDYYTRDLVDGSSQRFSLDGKLLAIYDKNKNFLKFKYEKDYLKEAEDNNGRKMFFKYGSNKKVREINGPNGTKAEYKFSNLDDLSWAKNALNEIYIYEYDDLHNLTKATWPDKRFIALGYDKKQDWVTSFTDLSKCVESYLYETSKTEPQLHYWATVKKVCGKETVANNRYEFWHKQKGDGTFYLSRLKTEVDGNTTEIQYDDGFGKPISIRRNAQKLSFDYYPDGLVKTKISPVGKMVFNYDSIHKKVSQVVLTILGQKGEILGTKQSTFKYDEKGNLTFAQNTDGVTVNVSYDNKGRIASITDQSKKVVKIEYSDKYEKPYIVTRPGLGSIKIHYKPSGEIDRVDSKDGGPSVAMQVASTFNYLLDVIAPATQEVYL